MQDKNDLLKRKTKRNKIKEKEKKEEKANKKEKKKEKEKKPEENKNKLPLLGIKENIVTKIQSIKSYKEEKIKEWNQKDKENLNINDLKLFVKEKNGIDGSPLEDVFIINSTHTSIGFPVLEITDDDLERYTNACISFWDEFSDNTLTLLQTAGV